MIPCSFLHGLYDVLLTQTAEFKSLSAPHKLCSCVDWAEEVCICVCHCLRLGGQEAPGSHTSGRSHCWWLWGQPVSILPCMHCHCAYARNLAASDVHLRVRLRAISQGLSPQGCCSACPFSSNYECSCCSCHPFAAALKTELALICRAGGTITAAELVRQIRLVASNKAFSGLILRVDSPGESSGICHPDCALSDGIQSQATNS